MDEKERKRLERLDRDAITRSGLRRISRSYNIRQQHEQDKDDVAFGRTHSSLRSEKVQED